MRHLARTAVVMSGLWIAVTACRQPDPPPVPQGLPPQISLTQTDEVVPVTSLSRDDVSKAVQADFNLDGQKDLAMVSRVDGTANELNIYIRAPDAPPAPGSGPGPGPESTPAYYRTANLRDSMNGRIVGIASRQRGKFTDLILLVSHTNAATEMLHYANDGTVFKLVAGEESAALKE